MFGFTFVRDKIEFRGIELIDTFGMCSRLIDYNLNLNFGVFA